LPDNEEIMMESSLILRVIGVVIVLIGIVLLSSITFLDGFINCSSQLRHLFNSLWCAGGCAHDNAWCQNGFT
jgi:hypothetical protein